MGTSLVDQWLRTCFQCRGLRFDPWSGSQDAIGQPTVCSPTAESRQQLDRLLHRNRKPRTAAMREESKHHNQDPVQPKRNKAYK